MTCSQQDGRIVCHFSCGAASAVATKLVLAECPPERVVIYNAFLLEEDEDNRRFLDDCERWFAHPITQLRDEKYGASAVEVWRRHRFMVNGVWGAPCSFELKREVIEAQCTATDIHVLGYTWEERHRAERFTKSGRLILTPLVDRNLTHADCLAMIERVPIPLPRMYSLGFNNANCKGCPKGGEGYWNKTRLVFPEVFQARQELQESIGPGAYFFRNRKTGERFGLKDLKPDAGRHNEELPSCSFFCAIAEDEIENAGAEVRVGEKE
jgi:hypothetical protein